MNTRSHVQISSAFNFIKTTVEHTDNYYLFFLISFNTVLLFLLLADSHLQHILKFILSMNYKKQPLL